MQARFVPVRGVLVALMGWGSLAVPIMAQHKDVERPAAWTNLVLGGRFMDRFEPIPLIGKRTAETWGVEAVKPRDVLNGMEDPAWSYWGGNILQGKDGLSAWEQITQGSNYPKVEGRFEDPVIWRTEVQYHMIVNDWYGRIAYHLRSKDGVHWKVDPGEAYQPGIALSEDGQRDEWYKYERIKVLQDEHGRVIQANFAVIDFSKWEDKPNDIHSSKNIAIPLTPGRLLTLLHEERITDATEEVRVNIAAESGFDPHRDMALESLRFGAPEQVDFGGGARLLRTERSGSDLVAVFAGKGTGFGGHNFAGKLLGRTAGGTLLFGYTRLPWVTYDEPILTVRPPRFAGEGEERGLKIEVSNHGLVASRPSKIRLVAAGLDPIEVDCPALLPYAKTNLEVDLPDGWRAGRLQQCRVITGLDLPQPMVFTAEAIE